MNLKSPIRNQTVDSRYTSDSVTLPETGGVSTASVERAHTAPIDHLRRGRPINTMNPREEKRLIERIQSGDRQAFEQLLDVYETRVYRLALRYTGDVSDAEDVTQEIFLGVYRGLGKFRGDSALGTWIYRVAMNHCLEYRRKRRFDTLPYDEDLLVASTNWRDDPLESAGKHELKECVEAALQKLSPLHRDVVVLHELQGLTYQEVAATLDVPVGTVKSRLSNALRKLRDLIGRQTYEGTAI